MPFVLAIDPGFPARDVDFTPTATTLAEAADQIAEASLKTADRQSGLLYLRWISLNLMLEARCDARGMSPRNFKFHVLDSGHAILARMDGLRIADFVESKEIVRYQTISLIGSMIDKFLQRCSPTNACEASNSSEPF